VWTAAGRDPRQSLREDQPDQQRRFEEQNEKHDGVCGAKPEFVRAINGGYRAAEMITATSADSADNCFHASYQASIGPGGKMAGTVGGLGHPTL